MKFLLLFLILFGGTFGLIAQPPLNKANWQDAGMKSGRPSWSKTVSILSYGGDAGGVMPNDAALTAALAALGGKPGIVFFPEGKYLFKNNIVLSRDSVLLKGASYNKSILIFDMAGANKNCIQVAGTTISADTAFLSTSALRYQYKINAESAFKYKAGDWVQLGMDDNSYFYSSWAYGLLIQTMQLNSVSGKELNFYSPFRFNYPLSKRPFIKRLLPRQMIGLECLKIKRIDGATSQTSLVNFDKAVNCWIEGVETDSGNFAHITLNQCSNVEVLNSYVHHAFGYGSGGEGYGIVLQAGSGECRIEGNIFIHLRHSILLQSAANGNVIGYNYSKDPYWTGTLFPANSAGDIVLHGNLPYLNLFEGNINQNTVIDDSHGQNGVYNTFFRNRSEGYGILMNGSPYTDSVQVVGHEVTNGIFGLYSVGGAGFLEYSNNVKGVVKPAGTLSLSLASLYLPSGVKPYCTEAYPFFPAISYPNMYNIGSNQAKDRFTSGLMAVCTCNELKVGMREIGFIKPTSCFPNPFSNEITINPGTGLPAELIVFNSHGQRIYSLTFSGIAKINTETWPQGFYLLKVNGTTIYKLIKD